MLTPYYQDEYATIYHGDCCEVLPQLESVDLVLTDPPYGLDWKSTGFQQNFKTDWQSAKAWDVKPEDSLIELIKQGGQAVDYMGRKLPCWKFGRLQSAACLG